MAVTLPPTPAAPAPSANHSPSLPMAKRRELARADVQAELTKLLLYGYGSLTIKVHAHQITALDTTTRMLEGQGEEG